MENYNTRQFMIFNVSELGDINFTQILETAPETCRRSVNGLQTFVKWTGENIPSSVDGLTTKVGPYNYTEILSILSTSGWTKSTPF
jgi:hypothetical protein